MGTQMFPQEEVKIEDNMDKLAEINNKDWITMKELLLQVAKAYYDWDNCKDLKEAKGVNEFVKLIISKVEAEKSRP